MSRVKETISVRLSDPPIKARQAKSGVWIYPLSTEQRGFFNKVYNTTEKEVIALVLDSGSQGLLGIVDITKNLGNNVISLSTEIDTYVFIYEYIKSLNAINIDTSNSMYVDLKATLDILNISVNNAIDVTLLFSKDLQAVQATLFADIIRVIVQQNLGINSVSFDSSIDANLINISNTLLGTITLTLNNGVGVEVSNNLAINEIQLLVNNLISEAQFSLGYNQVALGNESSFQISQGFGTNQISLGSNLNCGYQIDFDALAVSSEIYGLTVGINANLASVNIGLVNTSAYVSLNTYLSSENLTLSNSLAFSSSYAIGADTIILSNSSEYSILLDLIDNLNTISPIPDS